MKFTLRRKLFFAFMALNMIVSLLLGFFMYRVSADNFFSTFCDHKLSIARFISTAIDGDVHESFTSPETSRKPEFWRYLRIMNAVWKNERDVRYIYSINYDRKNDRLFYALDANIPDQDLMWFETEMFAFDMFFDKQGRMTVEYNYTFYNHDFEMDTDLGRLRVSLRDGKARKELLVQGVKVFEVLTVNPLSVICPAGQVRRNDRIKSGPVTIGGKTMECTVTYSGGGEPSSYPGNDFIETESIVRQIKKTIREKVAYVDREIVRNAYGSFLTAYSPIVNGRGEGIGLVCVDINSREVDDFKRSILLVAVAVSAMTLVLATFFALFLSRHFTRPLAGLITGVNRLASGDMNAMVEIRGRDEFRMLAENFNSMVKSLNASSQEQKRLIDEISELNDTLEQRVIERTQTIQDQSEELNRQIMMARGIQMSLLPVRLPDLSAVTLGFKYMPMMAVGGDFIDYHYTDRDIMLFICDVSGHGVPAAFLSAMVKMSLPTCYAEGADPSLAMKKLHQLLQGKMGGYFISAVFCHINFAEGAMVSCNSGHPPVLVVRASGDVEPVQGQGRIVSEQLPFNATNVTTMLKKGDKVMLYTDGITEARNSKQVMFGEENVIKLLQLHRNLGAPELCEVVYRMVIDYVGASSPEFEDDITLMISEYNG